MGAFLDLYCQLDRLQAKKRHLRQEADGMATMILTMAMLPLLWMWVGTLISQADTFGLRRIEMISLGLFVRLEAKPGKEKDVAAFLKQGLQLANQEPTTELWFALRLGPSTFGVFDAFADESGR